MAIRVGVQGDTREECVAGLELLVQAGFVPVMLPTYLSDNRWMARAVPAPASQPAVEAPAGHGEGPGAGTGAWMVRAGRYRFSLTLVSSES